MQPRNPLNPFEKFSSTTCERSWRGLQPAFELKLDLHRKPSFTNPRAFHPTHSTRFEASSNHHAYILTLCQHRNEAGINARKEGNDNAIPPGCASKNPVTTGGTGKTGLPLGDLENENHSANRRFPVLTVAHELTSNRPDLVPERRQARPHPLFPPLPVRLNRRNGSPCSFK